MLRVKEAKFQDSIIDEQTGALVVRFRGTGRKTGPVWEPGQFLTDLPGGFIITVYPHGAAVLCDEASATETAAIQDAAR